MYNLGERIYEFRRLFDVTQKELAKAIGISRSYLVQIENGKRKPSEELRARIEKIINWKNSEGDFHDCEPNENYYVFVWEV